MNGAPRDSVALVTGASRGIGRAVALTLGRHGCAVAVNCREQTAAAEATAAAIRAAGGRAMAFTADVRDFAAVRAMVAAVTRELGEPDILINNAGIVRDKPLAFTTDEEWNAVVDTNLKGAFHGIKAVAKIMARRKRGRIVNISSVAGLTGDVLRAGYAAAKSGLIGLTKTAARELAASGVTVNAVAPGLVESDLLSDMSAARRKAMLARIPLRRFGLPTEVADLVLMLVSEPGAYITGEILRVDGGLAMRD
jgi:3-oxoacyl-[acyl-carrier protein] reductase